MLGLLQTSIQNLDLFVVWLCLLEIQEQILYIFCVLNSSKNESSIPRKVGFFL